MTTPPRDPTPDEIRRRCAVIRKEWTEEERLRRAGKKDCVTAPRVFKHPRRTR
ncbi:MAG: hypothetical protein IT428_13625 [Planctomycetaceae bacterium]|nr:hypothetical protein [Planctomycetaceae bacterium]